MFHAALLLSTFPLHASGYLGHVGELTEANPKTLMSSCDSRGYLNISDKFQSAYAARVKHFLDAQQGKSVCTEMTLLMSRAADLVNGYALFQRPWRRWPLPGRRRGEAASGSFDSCAGTGQLFAEPCDAEFDPPCIRTLTINGKQLQFARIYKNANRAISCNLDFMAEKDNSTMWATETLRFAVIRDPLARFVSAYSEIENLFQCHGLQAQQRQRTETYVRESLGSGERARKFILDLLEDRLVFHPFYIHLGAQTTTIVRSRAQIVGNLANLDEAWAKLQRFTGVSSRWRPEACQHPQTDASSQNPSRVAMQQLLDSNPRIVTALQCSVLLVDYVCLGLDVPPMQDDCIEHGFSLGNRSWTDHVSVIRDAHCPAGVQHFSG